VQAERCIPIAVALAIVAACSPAMENVGYTPHGSKPPPPPPSVSAPRPVWSKAPAVKKFARANGKRFPSTGHLFGKYDADIYVNETAQKAYETVTPGATAPSGSLIVQVHLTRDGTPGPVFAMERSESGWTYLEMDAEMHVQRKGRISPCVECHTHVATQDELFGVPLTGR
jgi:hypothetical protein